MCNNVTRQIRVNNISTVPCTVTWHMFLKEEDNEEFPSNQYFNVIFDLYNATAGCEDDNMEVIDGQLLLTNSYHGWIDYNVFKVLLFYFKSSP